MKTEYQMKTDEWIQFRVKEIDIRRLKSDVCKLKEKNQIQMVSYWEDMKGDQ